MAAADADKERRDARLKACKAAAWAEYTNCLDRYLAHPDVCTDRHNTKAARCTAQYDDPL